MVLPSGIDCVTGLFPGRARVTGKVELDETLFFLPGDAASGDEAGPGGRSGTEF